jgi:hypothetical protein
MLLAASTLLAVSQQAATAGPPQTCENQNYSIDGDEKYVSGDYQFNLHGERGDVYLGSALYCNRVSSLAIMSSFDSLNDRVFVEFGWVLGWSNCDNNYYSNPRLFIWWSGIGDGNGKKCHILASGGPGDEIHKMRVGDVDGDNEWNAYFDNVLLPASTVTTNFSTGEGRLNAERSNTSDSEYAEWLNMEEYSAGAWRSFANVRYLYDTDPDFHWYRLAADHAQVLAGN